MITVGMTFSPPVSATHNCVSRAIAAELRGEVSFKVMDGSPSLRKLRRAGEVFATGTMGEAAPVKEINDRTSNRSSSDRPVRIFSHFHKLIPQYSEK